jgi:hypothetical protein
MSDIRLRAITQIGKISRELEKTQGTRTELLPTERKKSKEEQLEAAGISTSTAKSFCARAERLLVKPCSLSVVELSLPVSVAAAAAPPYLPGPLRGGKVACLAFRTFREKFPECLFRFPAVLVGTLAFLPQGAAHAF